MSVNHNCIYAFSFQATIKSFNKAIRQPIIIAYIHSLFSQPTRHSAKQYVRQPSLHLNIQFYVSFISFNHHHIYTFSFQSADQPFNKALCWPTIIVWLHSAFNQPTNHSTECVSYPSSQICPPFLVNHIAIQKTICQSTITTSIHSALCQSTIIAYTQSAFRQPTNHSTKQYVSQSSLIHSVFSQSTKHSAKQYVSQPLLQLYVQLYVCRPSSRIYLWFSVNQ